MNRVLFNSFRQVRFKSYQAAVDVLNKMRRTARILGHATCADYEEFMGYEAHYIDTQWGLTMKELYDSKVIGNEIVGYYILFPKPHTIFNPNGC